MKTNVSIDAVKLANEVKGILEVFKAAGEPATLSIPVFEDMIMVDKSIGKKESRRVTEAVINTGVVGWEIFGNNFALLD